MNLPFFIARRYLFSKRKKNFINIISILSVTGVAFSTAALIIVLSVFNGLEDLLRTLNNSFDPEIKIQATEGKSMPRSQALLQTIAAVPGVDIVTEVVEDYAYVRYRDANQIVTLKGVSDNFIDQNRLPRENIVEGELKLKEKGINYALIGAGVRYSLSIATNDAGFPLQVYYIKANRTPTSGGDPSQWYSQRNILPGGVFSIIQNFDENFVIVPLSFAEDLLNYQDKWSYLEIKVKKGYDIYQVERKLEQQLGEQFTVLNHEEQHMDIYKLVKMEKLFSFLALTLLLIIGSINIFFSLSMLALDKKKDISVLSAMGADNKLIRNIFLAEGALIAGVGALLGLAFGGILCWLQLQYGLVSLGMETSITQGYPIKVQAFDFVATLGVVSIVTFLISIRPAILASRTEDRGILQGKI